MNLTMQEVILGQQSGQRSSAFAMTSDAQPPVQSPDNLADRFAAQPQALAALHRLIGEGLDGGLEGEVDDEWLASLAEDIRKRAATR